MSSSFSPRGTRWLLLASLLAAGSFSGHSLGKTGALAEETLPAQCRYAICVDSEKNRRGGPNAGFHLSHGNQDRTKA